MEASFWHERWEQNKTPFHQEQANPFLVKYFEELALAKGSRVFLPLCGKTLDIPWLLSNGYRVVGAELSKIAIEQVFRGLGVEPEVSGVGELDHYSAKDIDIFGGDIFKLSREVLGPIDAIYDRAALVALPEEMRTRYAAHLIEITNNAPQLLVTYEYDQSVMDGPPFSVVGEEVHRHYDDRYAVSSLEVTSIDGGLKRKAAATEHVWLLR